MVTPGLHGQAAGPKDPRRNGGAPRGATWFPLTLFGVLALVSSPLYAREPSGTADLFHLSDYPHDPISDDPGGRSRCSGSSRLHWVT